MGGGLGSGMCLRVRALFFWVRVDDKCSGCWLDEFMASWSCWCLGCFGLFDSGSRWLFRVKVRECSGFLVIWGSGVSDFSHPQVLH